MTMPVDEIRHKITAATGAKTATQLTASGIAVGVQMRPGDPDFLWSLVPIDDESRSAFVDELIAAWRRGWGSPSMDYTRIDGGPTP